jgi:hypothetical protein
MWTKVVIEGQVLSLKTFLFARCSYENVLFSSKCSHFFACLHAICCLQPTPVIEVSDKAGEIFKRKEPFRWQSAANTSVSKQ